MRAGRQIRCADAARYSCLTRPSLFTISGITLLEEESLMPCRDWEELENPRSCAYGRRTMQSQHRWLWRSLNTPGFRPCGPEHEQGHQMHAECFLRASAARLTMATRAERLAKTGTAYCIVATAAKYLTLQRRIDSGHGANAKKPRCASGTAFMEV